jgi:hypothetical protein
MQWVQDNFGGGSFVNKAGDSMTGELLMDFGTPHVAFHPQTSGNNWHVGCTDSGDFAIAVHDGSGYTGAGMSMTQSGVAHFPACPKTSQGPATSDDLCNLDYVSTQDNLRVLKSGDKFTGQVRLEFSTPFIQWKDPAAPLSWRMGENASGQFGLFGWDGAHYTFEAWQASSSTGRVTFPLAPQCDADPETDSQLSRVGWVKSWIDQTCVSLLGDNMAGILSLDFDTPEIRFVPQGASYDWRVGSTDSGTFAIMTTTGNVGLQIHGDGTATFPFNVSCDRAPSVAQHLVRLDYLQSNYYTRSACDGAYMKKSGGTFTGDITVDTDTDASITFKGPQTDWNVGKTSSGYFGIATTGGVVSFQITADGDTVQFPERVTCDNPPDSAAHLTRKDYVDSAAQALQDQVDALLARVAVLESA